MVQGIIWKGYVCTPDIIILIIAGIALTIILCFVAELNGRILKRKN